MKSDGVYTPQRVDASLRSPEHGLKLLLLVYCQTWHLVAPFAGAWIEICIFGWWGLIIHVAPFAGAWIEMSKSDKVTRATGVAPFAGAWIEIATIGVGNITVLRRSVRRSVD